MIRQCRISLQRLILSSPQDSTWTVMNACSTGEAAPQMLSSVLRPSLQKRHWDDGVCPTTMVVLGQQLNLMILEAIPTQTVLWLCQCSLWRACKRYLWHGGTPCYIVLTPKYKIDIFLGGKCLSRENGSQIFKVKKFCLTFPIIAQKNHFWKLINHMHSPHTALPLPKQIAFIVKTTNLGIVINTIVLWAVSKGTWKCSFAWLSRNKDWSAPLLLLYRSSVDSHTVYKAKHFNIIPLQNHIVNSFSSVHFCKHLRVQPQLIC